MYLTVEQIAERLQVHKETVKRWLRSGRLAGTPLGDRAGWRVTEDDLAAFLAARRQQSADERGCCARMAQAITRYRLQIEALSANYESHIVDIERDLTSEDRDRIAQEDTDERIG